MRHILSAQQFSITELDSLFKKAKSFQSGKNQTVHPGKILATLFYEPSTRTRLSFEAAALKLGMGVISTENATEFSSAIKGESIEDSIRVVATYADVITIRHPDEGAPAAAAAVSGVPIINAGDGKGEHPTQALLDLYTIQSDLGRLHNLKVVIGGDLAHGRTARSLAKMLSLYRGNKIYFVSTPELQISRDITDLLKKTKTEYIETEDILSAAKEADVIYWTRLQKERLADPKLSSGYIINKKVLEVLPEKAIIMHPLPRVNEISKEVDQDPRAAYFRQAENGLYVRMALLDELLGVTFQQLIQTVNHQTTKTKLKGDLSLN